MDQLKEKRLALAVENVNDKSRKWRKKRSQRVTQVVYIRFAKSLFSLLFVLK